MSSAVTGDPDPEMLGRRPASREVPDAAGPPAEDRDGTRAGGEDGAMVAALVEEHGRAMFGYALRLAGDQHLAQDLVQEALVRAWQHRAVLYEELGSVRGWLLTVVRNLAIDRARARQARPPEDGECEDRLPVVLDHSDRVVTSVTLLAALDRLSDDHRAVVLELYFRDRSVLEAAERLGVPPGTVKSRSYYALRQLRSLLHSPE